MSIKISGKEVLIVVLGGATKGGTGWGITASGKIIKIPDNNPLHDIAALANVVGATSNTKLKAQLEGIVAETVAGIQ